MTGIEIFNLVYTILNIAILAGFLLAYLYQFVYMAAFFIKKIPPHKGEEVFHKIGIVVSARNEREVIGNLIDSIKAQDYPAELVTVFVVADNCTDDTAEVARSHGAVVYERQNLVEVGKGYAMNDLFSHIREDYPADAFDAFCMFDADNLLGKSFLREINRTFSDGYRVVAGYRNSKNFGDNWISAGNALWFIHDAQFLNGARMRLGVGCDVKGTGFLFSREIVEEQGGWPFHLLTEDVEFSAYHGTRGEIFGYNPDAEFYDEQPTSFRQSWRQRTRWSKGGFQVFHRYGKDLIRGIFHKKTRATCWDMTMSIAPAAVLSLTGAIVNIIGITVNAICGQPLWYTLFLICLIVGVLYGLLVFVGALSVFTDWKRIHTPGWKKILCLFTFPIFIFTYLPVAVSAAFRKAQWKPIRHEIVEDVDDITKGENT